MCPSRLQQASKQVAQWSRFTSSWPCSASRSTDMTWSSASSYLWWHLRRLMTPCICTGFMPTSCWALKFPCTSFTDRKPSYFVYNKKAMCSKSRWVQSSTSFQAASSFLTKKTSANSKIRMRPRCLTWTNNNVRLSPTRPAGTSSLNWSPEMTTRPPEPLQTLYAPKSFLWMKSTPKRPVWANWTLFSEKCLRVNKGTQLAYGCRIKTLTLLVRKPKWNICM